MAKLKAGVVGLGRGLEHVQAYTTNNYSELVAVCDLSSERLSSIKEEYPEVKTYTDYKLMITENKLDLLSICTPDWLHYEQSIMALDRGINIICTKPLVKTINDAHKLIEKVEKTGLVYAVTQSFRYLQPFWAAKQIIETGRLGRIYHIISDHIQNKVSQFNNSPWYKDPEHVRHTMLGTGIHSIDLAKWFIDSEVVEVFAYGNHYAMLEHPTDDFMIALMQFADGTIGKIGVHYGAIRPTNIKTPTLEIFGTKGTLSRDKIYLGEDYQSDWDNIETPPVQDPVFLQVSAFVESVLDSEKRPLVSIKEGAQNISIALAIVKSAQTGRPVIPERF